MSKSFDRDELNMVSMQVILHAGNARTFVIDALTGLNNEKPNFQKIDEDLKKAHDEITKAHNRQTDMIQHESQGEFIPFSVLFSHAQDTLMTIQSELILVEKLVPIFRRMEGEKNNE